MAQLVERSLPTPEVRGSNPVIDKLLYTTFVYCQLYWKDGNKEKEAGKGPFKKQLLKYHIVSSRVDDSLHCFTHLIWNHYSGTFQERQLLIIIFSEKSVHALCLIKCGTSPTSCGQLRTISHFVVTLNFSIIYFQGHNFLSRLSWSISSPTMELWTKLWHRTMASPS